MQEMYWLPKLSATLHNIFYSGLIIIIGLFIAKRIKLLSEKVFSKYIEKTLTSFLVNTLYTALVVMICIMALTKAGIPTTSLITVLGAASLAIALSLKDFLSNISAGILIILLRPFKIGDRIEYDKESGIVEDINLFQIRIRNLSNEVVFLPNHKVINASIKNQSFHSLRRYEWTVNISYGQDVEFVKSIIMQALLNIREVRTDPKPLVAIKNVSEHGIEIITRAWCLKEDVITLKFQVGEEVLKAFYKNNISIPQLAIDERRYVRILPQPSEADFEKSKFAG